jgi:hypothetical protein
LHVHFVVSLLDSRPAVNAEAFAEAFARQGA